VTLTLFPASPDDPRDRMEKFVSFEKYIGSHLSPYQDPRDLTEEELDVFEAEYNEKKTFLGKRARPHPNGRNYRLESAVQKYDPNTREWKKDWLLLDWIQCASNVSTKFRNELGNAIWSRSHLIVHNIDSEKNSRAFTHFINDRPAILNGIKNLKFSVGYESSKNGQCSQWTDIYQF